MQGRGMYPKAIRLSFLGVASRSPCGAGFVQSRDHLGSVVSFDVAHVQRVTPLRDPPCHGAPGADDRGVGPKDL